MEILCLYSAQMSPSKMTLKRVQFNREKNVCNVRIHFDWCFLRSLSHVHNHLIALNSTNMSKTYRNQ